MNLCDSTADERDDPADDVTLTTLLKSMLSVCSCSLVADVTFVVFVLGSVLALFGYVVPFVFLPSLAHLDLSLDKSDGAWLIVLLAVFMTVGRLASGILGDRKLYPDHRLVQYSTLMLLCGLSSVTVTWLRTFSALAVYSAAFGLLAGNCVCVHVLGN